MLMISSVDSIILWTLGDSCMGELVDLGEGGSVCSAVAKSSMEGDYYYMYEKRVHNVSKDKTIF